MDRYAADLFDRILRRTLGDRPRVSMAEVSAARLPQGIKAFLLADLQERLREDAAGTRWLRPLLEAPEGTPGEGALAALAAGFEFDAPDYRTVLGHAVHFLGNYLCRPQATLREFLYHDRDTADADHIRRRLAHCADYPYLTGLLLRYLERKDVRELSLEAFGVLVRKMDDLFLRRLTTDDHVRLSVPLFEYFESAGEPDSGAPAEALEAFFLEKQLDTILIPLRGIAAGREDVRITFAALRAAVSGDAPDQPFERPRREPDTDDEEPLPPVAEPDEPRPDAAEAPFVAAQEPPPKRLDLANAALALTYAGLEKPARLASLESLIPPAQREVFIRKVFHRDPDYFAAVLKALDRIQSWDEAADYLRRLYDTIGLDPFLDDVVKFTDLVHSRYTGGTP